jgi:hypothetical protein
MADSESPVILGTMPLTGEMVEPLPSDVEMVERRSEASSRQSIESPIRVRYPRELSTLSALNQEAFPALCFLNLRQKSSTEDMWSHLMTHQRYLAVQETHSGYTLDAVTAGTMVRFLKKSIAEIQVKNGFVIPDNLPLSSVELMGLYMVGAFEEIRDSKKEISRGDYLKLEAARQSLHPQFRIVGRDINRDEILSPNSPAIIPGRVTAVEMPPTPTLPSLPTSVTRSEAVVNGTLVETSGLDTESTPSRKKLPKENNDISEDKFLEPNPEDRAYPVIPGALPKVEIVGYEEARELVETGNKVQAQALKDIVSFAKELPVKGQLENAKFFDALSKQMKEVSMFSAAKDQRLQSFQNSYKHLMMYVLEASRKQSAAAIRHFLAGIPLEFYDSLKQGTKESIIAAWANLHSRFSSRAVLGVSTTLFFESYWDPSREELKEYFDKLMKIAFEKAYDDDTVVHRFLQGLPERLRAQVEDHRAEVSSPYDALAVALRFNTQFLNRNRRMPNPKKTTPIRAITETGTEIEVFAIADETEGGTEYVMAFGTKCFICGAPDHKSFECPRRRSPSRISEAEIHPNTNNVKKE